MRSDFAGLYLTMADEELLRLADDNQSLLPEAHAALDAELKRRDINREKLATKFRVSLISRGVPDDGWYPVSVPRETLSFPSLCPACLIRPPLSKLSIKSDRGKFKGWFVVYTHYQHLILEVPFCETCASETKRGRWIGRLLSGAGFIAGGAVGVIYDLASWAWIGLLFLCCAPGIYFLEFKHCKARIDEYDDEKVAFSLKAPEYAEAFYQLNLRVASGKG